MLGRERLAGKKELRRAENYEREQAHLRNLRRGYEAHLAAEKLRIKAGINRKLWRAYRAPA
jgi:ribosomal protein L31E